MKSPPFEIGFESAPQLESYATDYPLIFLSCCKAAGSNETCLDKLTGGSISRARAQSQRFCGRSGQLLDVSGFEAKGKLGRIVLLGTERSASAEAGVSVDGEDDAADLDLKTDFISEIFSEGARVFSRAHAIGVSSALWVYDGVRSKDFTARPAYASEGALSALLSSYRFDDYRTEDEHGERVLRLRKLVLSVSGMRYSMDALETEMARRRAECAGIFLARDLVNEPPNELPPQEFASRISSMSSVSSSLRVEVLDESALESAGFRALLAVARASEHDARVVIMHYEPQELPKGSPASSSSLPPLVFVGKGVTFDSGGLSLKPAKSMEDMKMDMGGAAAVVGALCAISQLGTKHGFNRACVGIVGLVENMPGGNAQRPGDIVRTLSGKTVEVLNTDAEGRLLLADLLWYAQERFSPCAMIDLATLTGAMIVALGEEYAGYFSNDEGLASRLLSCSSSSGEKIWRLPLAQAYDSQIDSPIADMKNIGGGGAGSITAAQFLQRFIKDGKISEKSSEKSSKKKDVSEASSATKWAHIDIAGVTWAAKARLGRPQGGSGFGVRLLTSLARDFSD